MVEEMDVQRAQHEAAVQQRNADVAAAEAELRDTRSALKALEEVRPVARSKRFSSLSDALTAFHKLLLKLRRTI